MKMVNNSKPKDLEAEKYYEFIKALQEEEFPDLKEIHILPDDKRYHFHLPSWHFSPLHPLITKEIVADMRDNRKKLLSVGCGPSYLEQLLVSRLGVPFENITLADISNKYVPLGFDFYKFDMHKDWPNLSSGPGPFDYIIFPESPLINVFFSNDIDFSAKELRQPAKEKGLYNLLFRALNVLNSQGQIRLTGGVGDYVRKPVKGKLESEFPNIKMGYLRSLTWVKKAPK